MAWLGNVDSNHDYLIQSQACCRCTIPQRVEVAVHNSENGESLITTDLREYNRFWLPCPWT